MTARKVVVTGGAGFIGRHLVTALLKQGADVHVVDDLSFGDRRKLGPPAMFHRVDVREGEALKRILAGAEVVFHLAAISSVPLSLDDPVWVASVNAVGTVSVLETARQCGVRRVVLSSSSAVYGEQGGVLQEDMPVCPQSPYGLSKLEGELAAAMFHRLYGLQTVSLRYFNVYGAGQSGDGPYAAVIAKFLEARKEGVSLAVTGDGLQTRDFVHVADVVRANIQAANSPRVGSGEAINIASGVETSILQLAAMFGGEIAFLPRREEIRNSLADVRRAVALLDFSVEEELASRIRELLLPVSKGRQFVRQRAGQNRSATRNPLRARRV
jgi:UDP-glucose 4-epimerase